MFDLAGFRVFGGVEGGCTLPEKEGREVLNTEIQRVVSQFSKERRGAGMEGILAS